MNEENTSNLTGSPVQDMLESEQPIDVSEFEAPIDVSEFEAPIDMLESEAPLDVLESEAPLDVSESEAPLDVSESEAPIDISESQTDISANQNDIWKGRVINENIAPAPIFSEIVPPTTVEYTNIDDSNKYSIDFLFSLTLIGAR
jgi:hypothetical protein